MKLKVLVDNNTLIDSYYLAEPAVSYLIEDRDTKILFDLGYSDIFIQNANKMSETFNDIDYVVLSHGHNDHTGGLVPLAKLYSEKKASNIKYIKSSVVAHNEIFSHKEYENEDIGSFLSKEKVSNFFKLNLSNEPYWINENIVFLGEVKRTNDFENIEPIGKCQCDGILIDDFVKDDSALVYKSNDGLVIITGCSHVGICNIIEYAKKVCNDERVLDVIGGFHLLNPSLKQDKGTMNYFENSNIKTTHPCHCTSLEYKIKLSKFVKVQEIGVGQILEYK